MKEETKDALIELVIFYFVAMIVATPLFYGAFYKYLSIGVLYFIGFLWILALPIFIGMVLFIEGIVWFMMYGLKQYGEGN